MVDKQLRAISAIKALRKVRAVRRATEQLIGLSPDKWLVAPEMLRKALHEKYGK